MIKNTSREQLDKLIVLFLSSDYSNRKLSLILLATMHDEVLEHVVPAKETRELLDYFWTGTLMPILYMDPHELEKIDVFVQVEKSEPVSVFVIGHPEYSDDGLCNNSMEIARKVTASVVIGMSDKEQERPKCLRLTHYMYDSPENGKPMYCFNHMTYMDKTVDFNVIEETGWYKKEYTLSHSLSNAHKLLLEDGE